MTPDAPLSERTMRCDACGEGDDVVFEAFMYAVGDGTVIVQRGEYMAHGFFDVFQAV